MNRDQQKQVSALRQINAKGKTIVYTSVVTGAYDPATSRVASATTPKEIKAVVSDAGGSDLVNGTLVARNDKAFSIAALALPVVPEPSDFITLDGYKYAVYSANPIFSGELPVLYTIKARRA